MNGDEQIRLLLVSDGGTRFQRDEGVVLPRENHLRSHPRLEQLAQALADIQNEVLFFESVRADRARIMPAVAGLNNNPANFDPQGPNPRAVSRPRRLSFPFVLC